MVNEKYARSLPKKEDAILKLIYVDEISQVSKECFIPRFLEQLATASATLAGLTPNPEVTKFIKTKLKELGHPPSVSELAAIEEQAAKLDKDLFKGTEDENFPYQVKTLKWAVRRCSIFTVWKKALVYLRL